MTLAALRSDIRTELNRPALSDAVLDRWIGNARRKIDRDLRVMQQQKSTDIQMTAQTSPLIALPTDYHRMQLLEYSGRALTQRTVDELRRFYGNRTGFPRSYAIVEDSVLTGPTTDESVTLQISYHAYTPDLTLTTSNWIYDEAPDLYLYASLLNSASFLRADQRRPFWRSSYEEIRNDIKREDALKRMASSASTRAYSALSFT